MDPHPLSITANGGNIIAKIALKIDIVSVYIVQAISQQNSFTISTNIVR